MALYKFTGTSTPVFSNSQNLVASSTVGMLRTGAIVNGSIENDGKVMSITSVENGEEYYSGVVENMYCEVLNNLGTVMFEKTDSNSEAETGDGGESSTTAPDNYIDDAFTLTYSKYMTDDEYRRMYLEGLKVSNLRGIMGLPHQFLPNTDPRLDLTTAEDSFGRVYADKIIAPMPLLFMTPGTPSFMSSFSDSQKTTLLTKLFGNTDNVGGFDELTGSGGGKYYSLKYGYIEYFSYVNAMLRSAAFFLGIQDEKLDESGKTLGELNWYFDNTSNSVIEDNDDIFDNNSLSKFLGTYAGAVPFYIEAETKVDDSFSNSTTQSLLAGSIDSLSESARELNYLIGNTAGNIGAGDLYSDLMAVGSDQIEETTNTINSILGNGNILTNIMAKVQTILSGGRMVFPEIWSDSSFSRSYRCSVKLISPSGDKLSIFYNILVPIYHLLAFVLPRNSSGQSFYSPFLVRAYYKGIFNVDMGIITDMNITKGSDGEWTTDGLPTTAEISFEIKDLYDVLSMSKAETDQDRGILSNLAELDYIANSCGINYNETDIIRTVRMAVTLGLTDKVVDKVTMGIFGNIQQYFNNRIQNIFGQF